MPRRSHLCQHLNWPTTTLSICQRQCVRSDQSDSRLVFELCAFWGRTGLQLLHWAPFDCQADYPLAGSYLLFSPLGACLVWPASHLLGRKESREAELQGCLSRQPFALHFQLHLHLYYCRVVLSIQEHYWHSRIAWEQFSIPWQGRFLIKIKQIKVLRTRT